MEKVTTSPVMALNITTATFSNEEIRAMDARELHKQLGNKRKFADWITQRIEQYGFVESEDFHKIVKPHQNNRTDYILTLDTAKEIAMVENNEQGRKIRKYLIQIEKEYREGRIGNPSAHHTLSTLNFNYSEDIPLNFTAKDVSTLGVKFYQAMSRIAEKMEEQQKYIEYLEKGKELLAEQHELIGELTAENGKLTKENHSLKNDPLSMLVTSLKIATGREVQLSLGPTTGQNIDHTHTTIKGFCAEHKIKLAHGDSIRFSNILKSLCKQAGEIIEKIPDACYGTLNIYPRYLLADAIKFL